MINNNLQKTNPLVSIIIPIFNAEKYLEKCLTSVINQTYKNLEIILVDDGSTDQSAKICSSFASQDKRIVFLQQINAGPSAARNNALDHSKGDYVTFVDSDDLLHPQAIQILLNAIIDNSSDISICSWEKIYEQALDNLKTYDPAYVKETNFYNDDVFDLIFNNKIPLVMVVWAKLYKKEIFKDFRFPEDLVVSEDDFAVHHIFNEAKCLTKVDLPLYFYLQRKSSLTGSVFSEKKLGILRARYDKWLFCKENRPNFEQKALSKYLVALAISFLRYKKAKGNPETLKIILDEFKDKSKLLKKKNMFLKVFRVNKTLAWLIVVLRDKIKS